MQIFATQAQRIVGLTKKGKDFFKLTSSLSEPINHIVVEETRMWTSCEFVYNMYDNGKDVAYYMSRDQINSMVVDQVTRSNDYDPILGCQDSCLRIVQGSNLSFEVPTAAAVTALTSMYGDEPRYRTGPAHVAAGLGTGEVSMIQLRPNGEFSCVWSVQDSRRSSINCMRAFDINRDGVTEVIVGREDGRLEILGQDGDASTPTVRFSKNVGEG